jgi:hypothetical protein
MILTNYDKSEAREEVRLHWDVVVDGKLIGTATTRNDAIKACNQLAGNRQIVFKKVWPVGVGFEEEIISTINYKEDL